MIHAVADIPCGLPGINCSPAVGYVTVAMAFIVFVGSIYLLLSAAFGPRMAYFVLAAGFFGWMILFSGIWAFGTGAPESTNLGPRGTEAHWQPVGVGIEVASPSYPVVSRYPGSPWVGLGSGKLGPDGASSVQSVTTAIQEFMAERANEQNGVTATSSNALESTDFSVENVEFTTQGSTSLAAATAFFNGGGPKVTVFAFHDAGSVSKYSWMFFGGSILGFAIHVPFLDRAERRRKAVLTGGKRPPWYGPA